MAHYRQLSLKERYQIGALHELDWSCSAIAERLQRHRSTIWRELGRNSMRDGRYIGQSAQVASDQRRRGANKAHTDPRPITRVLCKLLRREWSPEQIAAHLKQQSIQPAVSHAWIYRFVERDKRNGGTLSTHLRQGHRIQRRPYGKREIQSAIPNRIDISQRPACVDARSRLGDWEADTVIGSDLKAVLVTLVERRTGLLRSARLDRRFSAPVADAIIRLLKPIRKYVKTITFDNGTEFGRHQRVARALDAQTFFAKPYSSWQRGSNENTNGLLRQYFPKKTDFRFVDDKDVAKAVNKINNRPRKRHGFVSPNDLFRQLKLAQNSVALIP